MKHLISTGKFKLRPVQATDVDFIYTGLSNHSLTKYYAVHFDTLEETEEQMNWYANLHKEGTGLWWVIEDINISQLVGAGGFNDLNSQDAKAEIGFWVLPEFWGQGIMKVCFPLIINYGLNELELRRIEGYVESDNMACKTALAKTNFKLEKSFDEFDERKQKLLNIDLYAINV